MRALLALLVVSALLAPSVGAHARPVTIWPEAGARLDTSPPEIRIEFNEPINARATVIELYDANGTRLDTEPARVEGRTTARVAVELNTTDQGYLVRWSTYSSVDGHRMAGSWGFAVGNATPPQAYQDIRSPLAISTVFARTASYLGLVGLVAITWLNRSPLWRPPRLVPAGAASVTLLFLGSTFLFLQGASVSGDFFADTYTRRVIWQVLAAILLGVTIGMRAGRAATIIRASLLMMWIGFQGFSSHAAGTGTFGALLDSLHLGFVALWLGIVTSLWLDRRPGDAFSQNAHHVGRIALFGVSGAILTGILLALSLTFFVDRSPTELPIAYGLVFLYKLAAVLGLLGFGAVNQWIHLRRLPKEAGREPLLRANLRRELINAAIVLLLAAILATLDPQFS